MSKRKAEFPDLPDADTVSADIMGWSEYNRKLAKLIRAAEEKQEIQQNITDGIKTIEHLFRSHVPKQFPQKEFKPTAVQIVGKNNYVYNSGGVYIKYFGRTTWVLDDYDYFVDREVQVDGKTILSEYKQWKLIIFFYYSFGTH